MTRNHADPTPISAPANAGSLRNLVGGWMAAALCGLATGCRQPPPSTYQGYLEADYIYVAAALPGTLDALQVQRGQTIQAGSPLFQLEHAAEAAALLEAEQRLHQAEARLANLRKGRRPSEIESLEARLQQARANLTFSQADLARREKLFQDRVIAQTELDLSKTQRDANQSAVEALTAELATARLGAREDEISAGEAETAAARAARQRAQWSLDQKARSSPANATVHDTLFRAGEFVPAGSPVVALFPPDHLKVRFFVPQADLARMPVGQVRQVRIDGLPQTVPATVTYVSTQVEFTPPVIYNRENRAKLMVMVEASLPAEMARTLHVGQPVDVLRTP